MNRYLTVIFILLLQCAAYAADDLDRLRNIAQSYHNTNSIRASITQYVYDPAGGSEVLQGEYCAGNTGSFRIDYMKPERQIVVNNGEGLFWYYPERDLLFLSRDKKSGKAGLNALMIKLASKEGASPRIIYEGTKFYSFFKTAHIYLIEFPGRGSSIMLWVEKDGRFVIRKYVLDGSGREVSRELYGGHVRYDGIYLPSRIELSLRTIKGKVQTVTEYSNVFVNVKLKKNSFDFKVLKSMTVRSLDGN